MKSFKRICSMALAGFLLGCALVACGGGNAHAATNTIATPDGKIYSTYDVRTVVVANGSFQISRNGGNIPDAIADSTGSIFAAARLTAPAFKNLVQLGSSGTWINSDQIAYAFCQYGTSVPGSPVLTGGDHLLVVWLTSGYTMFEDANCATATVIRSASSH